LQVTPLAREVVEAVGLEYAMRLEEAIEGIAGAKSEQAAQLRLREPTTLLFFERMARQIAAGSLEPLGHIIRDVDGHLHG
jgi:hypothetical protein